MECDQAQRAMLDQEEPDPQALRHVEDCPHCREELEGLEEVRALLQPRGSVDMTAPRAGWEGFADQMSATLDSVAGEEAAASATTRDWRAGRGPWRIAGEWALAAAIIVVTCSGWYYHFLTAQPGPGSWEAAALRTADGRIDYAPDATWADLADVSVGEDGALSPLATRAIRRGERLSVGVDLFRGRHRVASLLLAAGPRDPVVLASPLPEGRRADYLVEVIHASDTTTVEAVVLTVEVTDDRGKRLAKMTARVPVGDAAAPAEDANGGYRLRAVVADPGPATAGD